MGNKNPRLSTCNLLTSFSQKDWVLHGSNGIRPIWRNTITDAKAELYTKTTIESAQIQRYEMRCGTESPIVEVIHFVPSQNGVQSSCTGKSTTQCSVLVEFTQARLSQVEELDQRDALLILRESLSAYSQLQPYYGLMHPDARHIAFNQVGQVKLWINSDFSVNEAERGFDSPSSAKQCDDQVKATINGLLDLVANRTIHKEALDEVSMMLKPADNLVEAEKIVAQYMRIHLQTDYNFISRFMQGVNSTMLQASVHNNSPSSHIQQLFGHSSSINSLNQPVSSSIPVANNMSFSSNQRNDGAMQPVTMTMLKSFSQNSLIHGNHVPLFKVSQNLKGVPIMAIGQQNRPSERVLYVGSHNQIMHDPVKGQFQPVPVIYQMRQNQSQGARIPLPDHRYRQEPNLMHQQLQPQPQVVSYSERNLNNIPPNTNSHLPTRFFQDNSQMNFHEVNSGTKPYENTNRKQSVRNDQNDRQQSRREVNTDPHIVISCNSSPNMNNERQRSPESLSNPNTSSLSRLHVHGMQSGANDKSPQFRHPTSSLGSLTQYTVETPKYHYSTIASPLLTPMLSPVNSNNAIQMRPSDPNQYHQYPHSPQYYQQSYSFQQASPIFRTNRKPTDDFYQYPDQQYSAALQQKPPDTALSQRQRQNGAVEGHNSYLNQSGNRRTSKASVEHKPTIQNGKSMQYSSHSHTSHQSVLSPRSGNEKQSQEMSSLMNTIREVKMVATGKKVSQNFLRSQFASLPHYNLTASLKDSDNYSLLRSITNYESLNEMTTVRETKHSQQLSISDPNQSQHIDLQTNIKASFHVQEQAITLPSYVDEKKGIKVPPPCIPLIIVAFSRDDLEGKSYRKSVNQPNRRPPAINDNKELSSSGYGSPRYYHEPKQSQQSKFGAQMNLQSYVIGSDLNQSEEDLSRPKPGDGLSKTAPQSPKPYSVEFPPPKFKKTGSVWSGKQNDQDKRHFFTQNVDNIDESPMNNQRENNSEPQNNQEHNIMNSSQDIIQENQIIELVPTIKGIRPCSLLNLFDKAAEDQNSKIMLQVSSSHNSINQELEATHQINLHHHSGDQHLRTLTFGPGLEEQEQQAISKSLYKKKANPSNKSPIPPSSPKQGNAVKVANGQSQREGSKGKHSASINGEPSQKAEKQREGRSNSTPLRSQQIVIQGEQPSYSDNGHQMLYVNRSVLDQKQYERDRDGEDDPLDLDAIEERLNNRFTKQSGPDKSAVPKSAQSHQPDGYGTISENMNSPNHQQKGIPYNRKRSFNEEASVSQTPQPNVSSPHSNTASNEPRLSMNTSNNSNFETLFATQESQYPSLEAYLDRLRSKTTLTSFHCYSQGMYGSYVVEKDVFRNVMLKYGLGGTYASPEAQNQTEAQVAATMTWNAKMAYENYLMSLKASQSQDIVQLKATITPQNLQAQNKSVSNVNYLKSYYTPTVENDPKQSSYNYQPRKTTPQVNIPVVQTARSVDEITDFKISQQIKTADIEQHRISFGPWPVEPNRAHNNTLAHEKYNYQPETKGLQPIVIKEPYYSRYEVAQSLPPKSYDAPLATSSAAKFNISISNSPSLASDGSSLYPHPSYEPTSRTFSFGSPPALQALLREAGFHTNQTHQQQQPQSQPKPQPPKNPKRSSIGLIATYPSPAFNDHDNTLTQILTDLTDPNDHSSSSAEFGGGYHSQSSSHQVPKNYEPTPMIEGVGIDLKGSRMYEQFKQESKRKRRRMAA